MPTTSRPPNASRTVEDLTASLDLALVELTAAKAEAAAAHRVSDLYEVLSHVTNALNDVIEAEARTVSVWRAWGATWAEIGDFYGTSRQAAQQRFGHIACTCNLNAGVEDFSASCPDHSPLR